MFDVKTYKLFIEGEDNKKLENIYKKQQHFNKEYGLDTTLLVTHFIKWLHPVKNKFIISPLLYIPIQLVRNQKIDLAFKYDANDEFTTINPIIKEDFAHLFDLSLKLDTNIIGEFVETLKTKLEKNGGKIKTVNAFNDLDEWQIITVNAIGNFNYKKSALSNDYKQVIKSSNQSVKALLGFESNKIKDQPKIELYKSDFSQQEAIVKALNNNSVIQGPPGTGKSHTIVELIKQFLLNGKKVLFVSEKQSALNVVYDKLKAENLDWLIGSFNSDVNPKKTFYKNLNKTLKKVDSYTKQNKVETAINKTKVDVFFKTYLHLINQPLTQNSPSILELQTYLAKHQVEHLSFNSKSRIPNFKEWQPYYEDLIEIESTITENFNCKHLSDFALIHLNKSIFKENHVADKISQRFDELKKHVEYIKEIQNKFDFNWNWHSIEKHCIAASVLNLANKSQIEILDPQSKAYKAFNTWTKKYELTLNKFNLAKSLFDKWSTPPKFSDIDSHIDYLKNNKSKFKLFKSKTDKLFAKNNIKLQSNAAKISALTGLKNYYLLDNNLNEIRLKLKHNLNILNPDVEIDQLNSLRRKLDALKNNEYLTLLEHENSLELINTLHDLQPKIQNINHLLKFLFLDFKPTTVSDIELKIQSIESSIPKLRLYLTEVKSLINLPVNILNFIINNENNIHELTGIVAYYNLLDLKRTNSTLKNLESDDILPQFLVLEKTHKKLNQKLLGDIEKSIFNKWDFYNNMINFPLSKLNDEQKEIRKAFKAAKRLIYHEAGKQQQHLPVKSLINDTDGIILDLLPLWLINPLKISESLPCLNDMFDVVIFDESSQIPLEDAIPAVYRAKQMTVVGDNKQMPPTHFFTTQTNTTTLLSQAETVFNSTLLKWHYRSEHPDLISFSNHHFYNNELSFFPENTNKKPIELIKIEDGIFKDGVNKKEAKQIAHKLKELSTDGIKSIGIIAFSKSQEKEINKQIKKLNIELKEDIEIRNLENTQGIEKDIILISVGYAPDENNTFKMNFGPINQKFGANRLNVLITRAKKQMVVFSSVNASDFKLSDNRGVQLLSDFIQYCETNTDSISALPQSFIHQTVKQIIDTKFDDVIYKNATNGIAINCFIQHHSKKILLIDPCLHPNENTDIITLLQILSQRFNGVKVLLTEDYWQDKTHFEAQINRFFA